ncbi:MAG: serine hydrolase [Prochlorothrix sp.]|nr:serine hydrolase [Prochlorothrix sp.]
MQTVDRRVARSRRRRTASRTAPRKDKARSASSRAAQAWGRPSPPRPSRTPVPLLYGIRLLILGVGLGVIGGTLLTALDPAYTNVTANELQEESSDARDGNPAGGPGGSVLTLAAQAQRPSLSLNQELSSLKTEVQALIDQSGNEGLTPGVMVVDLDTGNYLSVNGDRVFAMASMVKVPILLAFFQDVDAGKIRLDENLVMRQDLVAPHAGEMQYLPVGTQFTALETAEEMIRISDNTATNMLIDRLGGAEALNMRFRDWGLETMVINDWLPDLAGTNVSTPKDLALLMELINEGNLLSMRSRDRMLEILRTPVTRTLLPQGMGPGATIAHKTGDIGSLVGDVGIIDMPSGKRYLAAMMVERPHNDNRAQELIRQMARTTYQYLETQALQSDQPPEQDQLVVLNMLPLDNVATDQSVPPGTEDNPAMMTPFWSNP